MITLNDIIAQDIMNFLAGKFGNYPFIRFYSGERPAYPEIQPQGNVILAEVRLMPPTFFPAYREGGGVRLDAANLPISGTVTNTGVAQWFRAFGATNQNGGGQSIIDGSVTDSDGSGDCKLLQTSLIAGQDLTITSWQIYLPQ